MSHRAAMYSVAVHKRRTSTAVHFGDLAEQGIYLGQVLSDLLADNFTSASKDGTKGVSIESQDLDGEDLKIIVAHGQRGQSARIRDEDRTLLLEQRPAHTHEVRCGTLLRLPKHQTVGWWASHINNGRSAKTLLETELSRRFKAKFADLRLVVTPCVLGSALQEALDNDRLEKVKLVKLDRSDDRKDADKWVAEDAKIRFEVHISAPERGQKLMSDLANRALKREAGAFAQMVEFHGMAFDEAKVDVTMQDGSHRTFNIEHPESGHALSEELQGLVSGNGGDLEDASLFAALGKAIEDLNEG